MATRDPTPEEMADYAMQREPRSLYGLFYSWDDVIVGNPFAEAMRVQHNAECERLRAENARLREVARRAWASGVSVLRDELLTGDEYCVRDSSDRDKVQAAAGVFVGCNSTGIDKLRDAVRRLAVLKKRRHTFPCPAWGWNKNCCTCGADAHNAEVDAIVKEVGL